MTTTTPVKLSGAQVEEAARFIQQYKSNAILEIDGENLEVTPGSVTEESYKAVTARVAELSGTNAVNDGKGLDDVRRRESEREGTSQFEDSDDVLPGGIVTPEGFTFVRSFTGHGDTHRIAFGDLRNNVRVEAVNGLSAVVDGHKAGDPHGVLSCRVIVDHAVRGFIFRKDYTTDGGLETTVFYVNMGHGAPPLLGQ